MDGRGRVGVYVCVFVCIDRRIDGRISAWMYAWAGWCVRVCVGGWVRVGACGCVCG